MAQDEGIDFDAELAKLHGHDCRPCQFMRVTIEAMRAERSAVGGVGKAQETENPAGPPQPTKDP